MKLIPNAKKAWKLHSVWISGVAATAATIAATVWTLLTAEEQNAILERFGVDGLLRTVALVFIGVIIARLKAQPPKEPPK